MTDSRLSFRTLTVVAVFTAALAMAASGFPGDWLSQFWVSALAEGIFKPGSQDERNSSGTAAAAPTAVLLSWNTFGNAGTETSEPSVANDPNIAASSLTLGTGVSPAANANRLGGNNWFDTGDTSPTTLAESIAGNDYIQFVVTPNPGFAFTPSSLVFAWDRSSSGASSVTLRSSADGFTADLGTVGPIGVGAFVSNTIVISGVSNLTSPTTFRLYGHGATAAGGTGGVDAANNNPNVVLNGTVSAAPVPEIDVSAASMSFGTQPVGTTSGARSVTVTNSGSGSLNIGQLVKGGINPGDFTITADPSNSAIAPGGTAKIRVTFSPGSTGSRTAQITVPSNDADEASVVVGLAGTGIAAVTPSPVKSMWVWTGAPDPVSASGGRSALLQKASANGITDLYVSVYQSTLNSQSRRMYESSDVAALISAAHAAGIKVWAAYGDPAWQDEPCSGGQFAYSRMQEVAAFNAERAANERFDGVMLDVEPGGSFNLTNYANMHACFRGVLPTDIRLGTAISAFWSTPVEYPVGGETKPAYQHIIDLPLDQIVVMGYRDTAGTSGGNGIIGVDEDEIGYASSTGRTGVVLAGLETKDIGVPAEENVTFFEEGNTVLEAESAAVASHFASSSAFGGFSIHAYGDEYLSGVSGWPTGLPAPSAATANATLVAGTSATLNGLSNPNGSSTTGYFYFGTTNTLNCLTLGTRAPALGGTDLGAGSTEVSFSQAITGLTPATTYYFCAVAESSVGTTTGAIFQFTTSSPPISVATAGATSVTAVTATLNGLANPNGASTNGFYYYGTSNTGNCLTLGTRAPATGGTDLGSGTEQLPFSQAISGLTPSTTYYFCAVAESSGGSANGTVLSLTTAGVPNAVTGPASSVNATSATLNGFGTPNGAAATGYFRYGTTNPAVCDDTFGTRAPSSGGVDLGSGTGQAAFSQAITGLASVTTYYFCSVAENDGGKSFGSVFSFKTGGRTLVVDRLGVDDPSINQCTADPFDCTLRGALSIAEGGDTITFLPSDGGPWPRTLIVDYFLPLTVEDNVTIAGPGADNLTLEGSFSANHSVFEIASGLDAVSIAGLTITKGRGVPNGGAFNIGDSTVTLDRLWITQNFGGQGSGIYSQGDVTISNSTISENSGFPASAGAIVNSGGTMSIVNSTISGNSAAGTTAGGGIYSSGGTLNLTSVTITGNTADVGSGVTVVSGSATVRNSIIAGNTANATVPDVSGMFTSGGFNIIGNGTGASGFVNGVNGDQVGPIAGALSTGPEGGLTPIDPKIGPLENNGGTTPTHALLMGSPAIDAGSAFGLTADQRGVPRPTDLADVPNAAGGDGSDIGIFEMLAPSAASASISGRVTDARGRGISRARIAVMDGRGVERLFLTNTFGYFTASELPVGESFVVSVLARRYAFANPTVFVDLSDDIGDLNFVALK